MPWVTRPLIAYKKICCTGRILQGIYIESCCAKGIQSARNGSPHFVLERIPQAFLLLTNVEGVIRVQEVRLSKLLDEYKVLIRGGEAPGYLPVFWGMLTLLA